MDCVQKCKDESKYWEFVHAYVNEPQFNATAIRMEYKRMVSAVIQWDADNVSN